MFNFQKDIKLPFNNQALKVNYNNMKSYYYEHSIFFIPPISFIACWTYNLIRHWRDGKEGSRYYAARIILKILACLFLSVLEILHVTIISPPGYYIKAEYIFRQSYFVLYSLAWILSSYLVYFEYKRRIKPKWLGQRGFWVSSLITSIALLTINLLENNFIESSLEVKQYYMYQTIIYCFSVFTEFFLAYHSVFKPNDFFIDRNLEKPMTESHKEEETKDVGVSVAGYKVKSINGQQIAYFEIIVTVGKITKKVSKTFPEFEKLHSQLEQKFYSEIRSLGLIKNPKNLISSNLEERVGFLTEYLGKLCSEGLYSQELLDFLEVPIKLQDELKSIFQRGYEASNMDLVVRTTSELDNYFTPKLYNNETLTISLPAYHLNWMIDVQIPSWTRNESHIVYSIKSEIREYSFESWVSSRYSELLNLHKTLTKLHIPVPNFPSKHLSNSKNKDSDAIATRRALLEEYLGNIFNDPAYFHTNSLKFINCPLEMETILAMIPKNNHYSLISPFEWEGEIGNDASQYIAYTMKFCKCVLNKREEWEVTRRFREFVALHKTLAHRHTSFLLLNYLNKEPACLPNLPSRSLTPLCTCDEIEDRRIALEQYVSELLKNPGVTCCYAFRLFIGEIE